jgi:agmatinase
MKKFLESEIPDLPEEDCFFHVICAPMEETVSYGGGTGRGPQAILDASDQLEAFDGESCPCELGIHTTGPFQTLESIEDAVSKIWSAKHFPVLLGGEHTVTLGALRALKAAGEEFGVVQFDAHADLRDEYEGSKLSHACVMRRAVDDLDLPLFQIGVRAFCVEEHEFRKERGIPHLDASEISRTGIPEKLLPDDFPEKLYVTFDVDGLDPSVMPSTGTPVPNGLSWREAFQCLEKLLGGGSRFRQGCGGQASSFQCMEKDGVQAQPARKMIAADVVELAPIDGLHAPDFGAAQLVYRIMGLAARGRCD